MGLPGRAVIERTLWALSTTVILTSVTHLLVSFIWFLILCGEPHEKEGPAMSHMEFEDEAMDSRAQPWC